MDRNDKWEAAYTASDTVATREGGVDRNNLLLSMEDEDEAVATREGGVDRNDCDRRMGVPAIRSPPARVAWIETQQCRALFYLLYRSPPARVAWIETS